MQWHEVPVTEFLQQQQDGEPTTATPPVLNTAMSRSIAPHAPKIAEVSHAPRAKKAYENRRRVNATRSVGVLVDWKDLGHKAHGWIYPLQGVADDLPGSKEHGGDIYVHWKDIQNPREGSIVSFWLYLDRSGLGAEECALLPATRFVVPTSDVGRLSLPTATKSSAYFPSSVYYPDIDEKSVSVRKYLWDAPLTLFELWGEVNEIVPMAERLGFLDVGAEMLLPREVASEEKVREVLASEVPNIPQRFRTAVTLGGGKEARERLSALLNK